MFAKLIVDVKFILETMVTPNLVYTRLMKPKGDYVSQSLGSKLFELLNYYYFLDIGIHNFAARLCTNLWVTIWWKYRQQIPKCFRIQYNIMIVEFEVWRQINEGFHPPTHHPQLKPKIFSKLKSENMEKSLVTYRQYRIFI